jgi:hypothetical protein
VLPTVTELDAVEADPSELNRLRDDWLQDPRLEDRVVSWLGEQWHTLVDGFDIKYYDYGLDESQAIPMARSVGQEPLRLAARIVVQDRAWSEVVTSPETVADDLLLSIWPLEATEEGTGWRSARYTDNRPAAGVLATNGLWWRYPTNAFNLSRSRAAATVRLLVCEDLLTRPVSFATAPSLLDEDGTSTAIREEPACVACHSALEPLAATFFGFWPRDAYNVLELTWYHPEQEGLGAELLGVDPAWFGSPLWGLEDLGAQIAADPRFASCAVERFAQALWRRPVTLQDFATLAELRELFEAEGLRVKALLAALTETSSYQAAWGLSAESIAGEETARPLSPTQLVTAIEELTGFAWTSLGLDRLGDDEQGFRTLAGGVDGWEVLAPQSVPGVTQALVIQRLAQGAASAVVETDLAGSGTRVLLHRVDLDSRPGDWDFTQELADLHWHLFAQRPDDSRITAAEDLWSAVLELDGPEAAWRTLLTVLLRDPEFVTR